MKCQPASAGDQIKRLDIISDLNLLTLLRFSAEMSEVIKESTMPKFKYNVVFIKQDGRVIDAYHESFDKKATIDDLTREVEYTLDNLCDPTNDAIVLEYADGVIINVFAWVHPLNKLIHLN